MLKKRIIAVVTSIALLLAVAGVSGVADSLGYSATSQVHACNASSSSGGGC